MCLNLYILTFLELHYWTLTLEVSQTSTLITGVSSLIPSSSRIPKKTPGSCGQLLAILEIFSTLPQLWLHSITFSSLDSFNTARLLPAQFPQHSSLDQQLSLFPESHREHIVYEVSCKGKFMNSVIPTSRVDSQDLEIDSYVILTFSGGGDDEGSVAANQY
ncbi:hypothetical protein Tco_0649550 [Tanacetum coccineum]